MKDQAKTNISEIILVVAGFAAWIAIGVSFDDKVDQSFDLSNFAGTVIFFLIAFFVAERPPRSFLSRSQVLAVAAFMLWLAINRLFYFGDNSLRTSFDSTPSDLAMGVMSIAAPFAFYWGSTFLIRGYYAEPEYKRNQDESGPGE